MTRTHDLRMSYLSIQRNGRRAALIKMKENIASLKVFLLVAEEAKPDPKVKVRPPNLIYAKRKCFYHETKGNSHVPIAWRCNCDSRQFGHQYNLPLSSTQPKLLNPFWTIYGSSVLTRQDEPIHNYTVQSNKSFDPLNFCEKESSRYKIIGTYNTNSIVWVGLVPEVTLSFPQ